MLQKIHKEQMNNKQNHKFKDNNNLTKFLDFEEQKELHRTLPRGTKAFLEGGYDGAERKRAFITNEYYDLTFEDFSIKIYEIVFTNDFKNITHRHILGTIMSLGVNRNSFGDILVTESNYYLFVTEEISKYIEQNFTMVNHVPLTLREINNVSEIILPKPVEQTINVSSMRLDAIISRTLNKSRNDSSEIITKGLVLINHKECLNISYNVKIDDIISVRHFGRIIVHEILKTTKKDRLVLRIEVKK